MKKLLALLVTFGLPLLASDFPEGSPKFGNDFAKVSAAAKTSGKPMIIVFSASWCPPCQAMKKDVYPSAAVKAMHDKFEWAYLDTDEEKNGKVASKYGVTGIPHIQFLSKEGKDLGNQVGMTSAQDFVNTLEGVLKKAAK